jgi:NhaP-type Na+/H+ or K+/H+ antiporter
VEHVKGGAMPLIMILYYLITVYLIGLLVWNFIREKKSIEDMAMYLLVLIPLLLRVLRIK